MKRSSRRAIIVTSVALVLGLAGGGFVLSLRGSSPARASESQPASVTTASAALRELATTTKVPCAPDFGTVRDLPTSLSGVVTWVPDVDAIIRRGEQLFAVNGRNVFLLRGATPAWRELGSGITADADVAQLKAALVELNYSTAEKLGTTNKWTPRLTTAVKAFQKDRGLAQDGILPLGSVAFLPEDIRVDKISTALGAAPVEATAVLKWTSLSSSLACEISSEKKALAPVGGTGQVTLADGSTVTGTITDVQPKTGKDGEEDMEASKALVVTLIPERELADASGARATFSHTLAQQALSVPVSALIVLADGSYGVQRQEPDGTLTDVPVELGVFADAFVQVTAGKLADGDTVVVAP